MYNTSNVEDEIREKRFGRFSGFGYVIGWIASFSSPIIGAFAFIATAGLAWVSLSSARPSANTTTGMRQLATVALLEEFTKEAHFLKLLLLQEVSN